MQDWIMLKACLLAFSGIALNYLFDVIALKVISVIIFILLGLIYLFQDKLLYLPAYLLAFGYIALNYLFDVIALIVISVIIFILLGLLYLFQDKLLYLPVPPNMSKSPKQNPSNFRHPRQSHLDTEDLQLPTIDNIMLRGWLVKIPQASQIVVYFHENAGNIGYRIPLIKAIAKWTKSDVILVAYRGFSDSEGKPSEDGLKKDACTIIDYAIKYKKQCLKKGHQKGLFLYGRSLGGAVTIYGASQQHFKHQIKGIIIQNTFTNISDMIDAVIPVFKYIKFLQKNYWPSIKRITKIQNPILLISSLRDELVPPDHMRRLYQGAKKSRNIQIKYIETGTHNCSWQINRQQYFQWLNDFFFKNSVK